MLFIKYASSFWFIKITSLKPNQLFEQKSSTGIVIVMMQQRRITQIDLKKCVRDREREREREIQRDREREKERERESRRGRPRERERGFSFKLKPKKIYLP